MYFKLILFLFICFSQLSARTLPPHANNGKLIAESKMLPVKYYYSGNVVITEVIVSLPEEKYKVVVTAYRFDSTGVMRESQPSSEQIFFNMVETNLPPAKPVTVKVKIN